MWMRASRACLLSQQSMRQKPRACFCGPMLLSSGVMIASARARIAGDLYFPLYFKYRNDLAAYRFVMAILALHGDPVRCSLALSVCFGFSVALYNRMAHC